MRDPQGRELEARPGLFEVRRSRNHPWYAAKVEIEPDGRYSLTLDGDKLPDRWEVTNALDLFAEQIAAGENAFSHPLLAVFLFGREIDEAQYRFRVTTAGWARTNEKNHPAADPKKRIDFRTIPIAHIVG